MSELPEKHPSSEFQRPKVSDFRRTSFSKERNMVGPVVPHCPPVEALAPEEYFQTALRLFGLGHTASQALLEASVRETPLGIPSLGTGAPLCLPASSLPVVDLRRDLCLRTQISQPCRQQSGQTATRTKSPHQTNAVGLGGTGSWSSLTPRRKRKHTCTGPPAMRSDS